MIEVFKEMKSELKEIKLKVDYLENRLNLQLMDLIQDKHESNRLQFLKDLHNNDKATRLPLPLLYLVMGIVIGILISVIMTYPI